jgi:hypothetical protein
MITWSTFTLTPAQRGLCVQTQKSAVLWGYVPCIEEDLSKRPPIQDCTHQGSEMIELQRPIGV